MSNVPTSANVPLRILLVEDNPDDAVFVQELLHQSLTFPLQVRVADTLSGGFERLATEEIDVVLLDLSLPDSFGLATLESVLHHSPGVPILIMTGQDEADTGIEAVRKGAQDFLIKGELNAELLTRTIRYAVERHQARQELLKRENDIRLLTDQLPAVLWTTDGNLVITSSMGAGLTRLNLLPNQVVGMTVAEYFETNDERDGPLPAHCRALGGRSVSFETKVRGRTQQVHVEPWRPGGGPIAGVIGVALDVTERREIEEEMNVARHIQQALLPNKVPEIPGLEFAGTARPADATGGDFFDYVPLPDGQIAVVVGDVSGHGFGPAILTAAAHSYLRALTRTEEDLSTVLSVTNQLLIDDSPAEQYLTLFLVRLDPKRRVLDFVGAGHPAAFILDPQGQVRRQMNSCCSPFGWFRDSKYVLSEPISLEPGEIVLLLTDGIPEAMTPDKEFFTAERAVENVRQNRHKSAAEILHSLFEAVSEYIGTGKQRDDMTAVVIKVLPTPE